MAEYWTWWQGGLALGAVTILFRVLLQRPLGVSGSWARIASSRSEIKMDRQAQQLANDSNAMSDAIMAATLAEFGKSAIQQHAAEQQADNSSQDKTATTASIGQHAVFLVFIFIGGLLSAIMSGRFEPDIELSPRLTSLSHGIVESWIYLLLGGIMVGFGTQMAAGCTSGHGLSGCAQFSSTSLIATAVFFTSAVLTAVFFSVVTGL